MAKHGKRYLEARAKIDREKLYTPAEAVKLLKETGSTKFDQSVEVHVRTGLNVRHADEQLRGTLALPHGLGKDVTIAVFAKGDKAKEAEEAGADFVGAEALRRREAARQLPGDHRGAHPSQALGRQGPLHPLRRRGHQHGSRDQGRSLEDQRFD